MGQMPDRRVLVHTFRRAMGPTRSGLSFLSEVAHQSTGIVGHQVAVRSVSVVVHQCPGCPLPVFGTKGEARHFPAFDIHEVEPIGLCKHGLELAIGVHVHLTRSSRKEPVNGEAPSQRDRPGLSRHNAAFLQEQSHTGARSVVPDLPKNTFLWAFRGFRRCQGHRPIFRSVLLKSRPHHSTLRGDGA